MNHRNENGVALITGASSGIGATYADRLARRGYDLILVARNQQRLEDLAARLRHSDAQVEILRADLASKPDLARVEQRLRDDGRITMLVNNAGIGATRSFIGADLDLLETMIHLNVVAVMRLAGAVVPGFVARKRGTIINIASVVALAPELLNGNYSGTKAYVLNFSQSLYNELREHGVRVQVVLPGATRTEIWERSGIDISSLSPKSLMAADEMVDAALVGLDQGEVVTVPSLPDIGDWDAFNAARLALAPGLSRDHAAQRYKSSALAGNRAR